MSTNAERNVAEAVVAAIRGLSRFDGYGTFEVRTYDPSKTRDAGVVLVDTYGRRFDLTITQR